MARVLAVLPARGGSKSIPRKNLVDLGGKPLIAHMIQSTLAVRQITDFVVSTEDEEIAEVARRYGAAVPFMRPADLAEDLVPGLPVLQHAVNEMERRTGAPYDYIVLMQATAPLTRSVDIEQCVVRLMQGGCESVVTCVRVTTYHPFRMKRIIGGDVLVNYIDQGFEDMRPRQILPPVYKRSGGVYASTRKTVMENNTIVGPDARAVVVPDEIGIDIDNMADLVLTRFYYDQLNAKRGG